MRCLALVLLAACSAPRRDRCALPQRDCAGPRCAELVRFLPSRGPGYQDVPLDDEISDETSTSYLRRDLMMLVQYATAKVACRTGGRPLALGDMSDRNGAIPGTARAIPRHPAGTHTGGLDIDLAYYQLDTPDNHLRPVCPHVGDGIDQWHCVGPPDHLDVARTALLIGALYESPRVRVIGVDGRIGPLLDDAIAADCATGLIPLDSCARVRVARETEDTGLGWFTGHHNHLHVSVRP